MTQLLYGKKLGAAIKAKVTELTGVKNTTFAQDADCINAHVPKEDSDGTPSRRANRVTLQKMTAENSRPRIEQAQVYANFLGIGVDEIWWIKLYEKNPDRVAKSKVGMIPVFRMPFLRFADDGA